MITGDFVAAQVWYEKERKRIKEREKGQTNRETKRIRKQHLVVFWSEISTSKEWKKKEKDKIPRKKGKNEKNQKTKQGPVLFSEARSAQVWNEKERKSRKEQKRKARKKRA